jgi:hypothetical protein
LCLLKFYHVFVIWFTVLLIIPSDNPNGIYSFYFAYVSEKSQENALHFILSQLIVSIGKEKTSEYSTFLSIWLFSFSWLIFTHLLITLRVFVEYYYAQHTILFVSLINTGCPTLILKSLNFFFKLIFQMEISVKKLW